MSMEGVSAFVEKALNDEKFQAELKADPNTALTQFDLTPDEIAAIKSGSEERVP